MREGRGSGKRKRELRPGVYASVIEKKKLKRSESSGFKSIFGCIIRLLDLHKSIIDVCVSNAQSDLSSLAYE